MKFGNIDRDHLILLAGSLILGLFMYTKPMLGTHEFSTSDTSAPAALGQGIKLASEESGTRATWVPGIFSGMPTVHSLMSTGHLYYPAAIYGPLFKLLSLPTFWIFFAHMMFGALGTYVLMRHFGSSKSASVLASVAVLMMPYTHTMLVHGHGGQMMTLAYMPWVVWGLMWLSDDPTWKPAAVLALFTGFQLQRGHVQIAYYTLMLVGLMFLVIFVRKLREGDENRGPSLRFGGLFIGAMVVGLGLSMNLYMPVMNYVPYSIRGAQASGGTGFEYATQWSFSFGETMTFLFPSFYGFGGPTYWGDMPFTDYPNYMGIFILIFAGWAVIMRKGWLSLTLAAAAALAYLISMGHNFILYRPFYDFLPYFNKFRVPVMILVITQFCIALLAGLGLDHFLSWAKERKSDEWRKFMIWSAGTIVVVTLLGWLSPGFMGSSFRPVRGAGADAMRAINGLRADMIRFDALWLIMMAALALWSVHVWKTGGRNKGLLVFSLVVLTVVDMGRIDWEIIHPDAAKYRGEVLKPISHHERYLGPDPVIEFLQADTTDFRIYPMGPLLNENRWAAFGLESLGGYFPAKLNNYNALMSATNFASEGILKMLNVKYLISLQKFEDPRFEQVFLGNLLVNSQFVPAAVYQFNEAMNRAWIPEVVTPMPESTSIFEALKSPSYDPAMTVFITADNASLPTGRGTIGTSIFEPMHIELDITMETEGLVVLSEVHYPEAWVARVGEIELPIYEINGVLRGVVLSEGSHRLTLDFEPTDLRRGSQLSWLSLAIILGIFVPGWGTAIRRQIQPK